MMGAGRPDENARLVTTKQISGRVQLSVGEPAPWFTQRSGNRSNFAFDTAAGRYVVLCFFGSASDKRGRAAVKAIVGKRTVFDDIKACFFGVSLDESDETKRRVFDSYPGLRFIWDFDGAVSKLYGALPLDVEPGNMAFKQLWFVLDPTLRVLKILPFSDDGRCSAEILAFLQILPAPSHFAGFEVHAPVLILPNVLELNLCRHLVGLYEANGGKESGFMRDVDGKTMLVYDPVYKRRGDFTILDTELRRQLKTRISRCIVPEIRKICHFTATRIERFMVSCYSSEDGGRFAPHRDNTTRATAHQRFAVSINLNSDYTGGEITFPEYGPRSFKPGPGGALVFSCSLLHTVSTVRAGKRYAFLPFLYDDAAARIREQNVDFSEGDQIHGADGSK